MKQGILLCALGHSNYFRMAEVLAASIRASDDQVKICLITDKPAAELKNHGHLFDIIKGPTTRSIIQKGKTEFIKAKLFMYHLSPFDETIFLDVDQILIPGKKISPFFQELESVDLTCSNTGLATESIWADIKEVKKLYGDRPFWNYHSEFFYFKKGDVAKKFFEAAIKVYEDDRIRSSSRFSNAVMADELAFQCAAIVTGTYPHKENWLPNFWYDRDHKNSRKYPYQLTEYTTYSIGGNQVPAAVKANYNTLAKACFAKLGLSNPYQVVDKRSFLPERKTV